MKQGYAGDVNARVKPNWLLCMTIYRKYLPLIKQRNCLCAASCIKASFSFPFADWGNPPAGWMPLGSDFCSLTLAHTLQMWHPSAKEEKKNISSHTCWWIIFVHKAQTGQKQAIVQVRHGFGIAVSSHGSVWMKRRERLFTKNSKETCGQVRAIIIDKLRGGTGSSWGMDSYKMVPPTKGRFVLWGWMVPDF